MFNKIYSYFSVPRRLVYLNTILIFAIVAGNSYYQLFCMPVIWAKILLIICFFNTIAHPLIKSDGTTYRISSFVHGITFCVLIYCLLFLENVLIYGLLAIVIGIGLLCYIPFFLLIQIALKSILRPKFKSAKPPFISAVIVCLGIVVITGFQYKQACESVARSNEVNFKYFEGSYLSERIIGMHFLYHTKICEYDGWRPPLHDPILVIGMRLNGMHDPLNMDLLRRIELYHRLFPENDIKLDCSCAMEESNTYHNDQIWKKIN